MNPGDQTLEPDCEEINVDLNQDVPAPYRPKSGDWVGDYQLIRKLGEGGMGSVWLARSAATNGRYAIKFLNQLTSAEYVERFEREAKTLGDCQCDHVVNVFWYGWHDQTPFIVTEFVDGRSLKQEIDRVGALPLSLAAEYIISICKALTTIHSKHIIHRDIKSTNIIISNTGRAILIDFGISKRIFHGQNNEAGAVDIENIESNQVSGILGTIRYMSREQLLGKALTPKTDSYSLGIVLLEALTGKPFFGDMDVYRHMKEIGSAEDYPPVKLGGKPDDVVDLINACLRKDPTRRPTPIEMMRVLEKYQHSIEYSIDLARCPYPGLASFSEQESVVYFGRDEDIRALCDRVRLNSIVLLAGDPGVGKTSLIRAGVGDALKREGWHATHVRPGIDPLESLTAAIAPMTANLTAAAFKERIKATPTYAGVVVREYAERIQKNILVAVDAFEELFILSRDENVREKFVECMLSIADDPASKARVLIGMRADFLNRLTQVPGLASAVTGSLYLLSRPTAAAIFHAIVRPAQIAHYIVKREVAQKMAQELSETDSAFLLMQFVFSQIWPKRDPSTHMLLDERTYQEIGGVAGALGRHAESVLMDLPEKMDPTVRRVLTALVTPERTRAVVRLDQLYECSGDFDDIDLIIRKLVKGRLLLVQENEGTACLIHDALITHWDRLRQTLDQMSMDDAFRQRLQNASRAWANNNRDDHFLWAGEQAWEAKRFSEWHANLDELPQVYQDFIGVTVARLELEIKKKRRRLVAGISALAMVAVGALVAVYLIGESRLVAKREALAARMAESKAKESESIAQQAKREALANAHRAESISEQLKESNASLLAAVSKAEEAQSEAEWAQSRAEKNAKMARIAEEKTRESALMLQSLLRTERERAQRLEYQLGKGSFDNSLDWKKMEAKQ